MHRSQIRRRPFIRSVRVVKLGGRDNRTDDFYGHGTLVTGLIAATGAGSSGAFIGIAPGVNVVSVKVERR